MVVPLPAAMRLRREPLMSSGWRRSWHGHREHDRFHAAEVLLRTASPLPACCDDLAAARQHAEHAFERAHVAQLAQLRRASRPW